MAKSLRLFRNQTLFDNKELAIAGLQGKVSNANDGELIIARYTDAEDSGKIKTLMMLVYVNGETRDYTIFDSEAIPAEVTEGIVGNLPDSAQYTTIEEINSALTIINGDENTEGSIAYGDKQTYDSAVTYVNEQIQGLDVTDVAVEQSFVTEVSETDGKIAVKRGAITSTDSTVTITNGADGGINLSVNHANVDAYKGLNAIAVSETADTDSKKEISLVINANDHVLNQNADGLLANLNLTWSTADGLKLIGKDGYELATVPATDFVKDGMLENVELKVASADEPVGEATGGTFLVFTFNTDGGAKVINLDVTSLIDVYTGSNGVQVDGKAISAVRDASSEAFFYIGATGMGVSGVTTAIADAVAPVQTEVDAIETAVGLGTDGSFTAPGGNYVANATTVIDAITKLDTQTKTNTDAIAQEVADRTETDATLQEAIDAEEQARETAVSGLTEQINTINQTIEQIQTEAVSVVAGNGISVTGDGAKKTIAAIAKADDPIIEVTTEGIKSKDDAIWDCGTY